MHCEKSRHLFIFARAFCNHSRPICISFYEFISAQPHMWIVCFARFRLGQLLNRKISRLLWFEILIYIYIYECCRLRITCYKIVKMQRQKQTDSSEVHIVFRQRYHLPLLMKTLHMNILIIIMHIL